MKRPFPVRRARPQSSNRHGGTNNDYYYRNDETIGNTSGKKGSGWMIIALVLATLAAVFLTFQIVMSSKDNSNHVTLSQLHSKENIRREEAPIRDIPSPIPSIYPSSTSKTTSSTVPQPSKSAPSVSSSISLSTTSTTSTSLTSSISSPSPSTSVSVLESQQTAGGVGHYNFQPSFPIHDMFKSINFEEIIAKGVPNPKSGHIEAFSSHPFHAVKKNYTNVVDYMVYLQTLEACRKKPLFVTLARVQNELYWQLIENFFYAMYMFNHLECTVMICIADQNCLDLCEANRFPCFDYDPVMNSPKENNKEGVSPLSKHVMEHVAEIKLYHVGQAVQRGVNVMLLDLDVGFLRDPLLLYEGFLENSMEHVRAQMDMGFSTNRSSGNTWYAHPRPNFGLFLVKAHPFSSKVFQQAWKNYLKIDGNNNRTWEESRKTGIRPNRNRLVDKTNVAVDQNTIVGALKWARWRFDYNFSYFYLGFLLDIYPRPIIPLKVVLLDKMPLVNRNESAKIKNSDGSGQNVYVINHDRPFRGELGGALAQALLYDVIAAHATCHEGGTKLLGLKAANAFWNNNYYSNKRKTITKPLIFQSKKQLTRELLALYYIAMMTNRSLLIPNVLIGVGMNIKGQLDPEMCKNSESPFRESFYCREKVFTSPYFEEDLSFAHDYKDEYYWPSWRTAKQVIKEVTVVEPAYYYRLAENYYKDEEIPKPYVHSIDLSDFAAPEEPHERFYYPPSNNNSIIDNIIQSILDLDKKSVDSTRLVLDVKYSKLGKYFDGKPALIPMSSQPSRGVDPIEYTSLEAWATDSISDWKAVGTTVAATPTFDDDYFDMDYYRGAPNPESARRRAMSVAKFAYVPLPFVAADSFPAYWVTEKPNGPAGRRDAFSLCRTFLQFIPTNRSCFDKCK